MFIFQFLFFIFILFLVVGLIVVSRIYMTIRRTAGKFRDFAGGGFKQQGQKKSAAGYGRRSDPAIIDTRSEEVRNRKIFPDNVGDFVKFKDVRR